jgi:hypothetical protein
MQSFLAAPTEQVLRHLDNAGLAPCPDFGRRQHCPGFIYQIGRPADQKGNALLHVALHSRIAARLQEIGCTFPPDAVV